MVVIQKEQDPELHRKITDANLLRQFDFMKYAIEVAHSYPDRPISHDVIRQLNNHVTVFLCDSPGRYRECPVTIRNSEHRPPDAKHVAGLMDECLVYLGDHWNDRSITHLAAYALWRLNWIHPFVEGNGRTARATCYYVMCVRHGFLLPGTTTIPRLITNDRKPYYDALAAADIPYKTDRSIDLGQMEKYLEHLLVRQLET